MSFASNVLACACGIAMSCAVTTLYCHDDSLCQALHNRSQKVPYALQCPGSSMPTFSHLELTPCAPFALSRIIWGF